MPRVDELQRESPTLSSQPARVSRPPTAPICATSCPRQASWTPSATKAILSGTSRYLSDLIHDKLNSKSRAIEFSTLQRCASHLASRTDVNEAYALLVVPLQLLPLQARAAA